MIEWSMNVAAQPALPPAIPVRPDPAEHSSSFFRYFCTRSNKISRPAPSSPRSPIKKTNAFPPLRHSFSLFRVFCTRSNKISHLFSTTCTLFLTLKKISHLFSHSSQKYPRVGGGIVSLSAISRDNVSQVLWNQHLRKKGGGWVQQALLPAGERQTTYGKPAVAKSVRIHPPTQTDPAGAGCTCSR